MPRRATDLSREDLDRIRQAASRHLQTNFDGTPTRMRVVLTTYHDATTAIQGGRDAPPLPPDPRPVDLVVVEGDFIADEQINERAAGWQSTFLHRSSPGTLDPCHRATR